MNDVRLDGNCQGRFSKLREVFEASFEKGEVGASVSVVIDGEPVVDLWGGFADADRTRAWERDTIANVYSTTKGMTAICAHRLVDEGRLDLDLPVAKYWPEFGEQGKEEIPVRMLLSHQTGLCAVDPPVAPEHQFDWDRITGALAAQKPFWEPGTRHGYHAMTFGHLVGEVVRRIDGRSLGSFFRDEIAVPLGADFHIGLAEEHDPRCADLIPAPRDPNAPDFLQMLRKNPDSLAAKVFGGSSLEDGVVNSRAWRAAEIPAGNGHGTARALARVYGALARGGEIDGIRVLTPEGVLRANSEQVHGEDAVLGPLRTRFGLGFMMTQPMIPFGPNPRSFGHPGAGGSIAFADPDAKIGFGYVMNQMQMGLAGGAHGFALIAALYEAAGLTV